VRLPDRTPILLSPGDHLRLGDVAIAVETAKAAGS